MSSEVEGGAPESAPLSSSDRAAAFAAGAPKAPRQVIYIALVVVAVLGLGGTALERLLSNAGLNPAPGRVTSTTAGVVTLPSSPSAIPQVGASLAAFMGIVRLPPTTAPGISLVDQFGRPFSIASEHGDVVVLSFFDVRCTDICPVLGSEIAQADSDLGSAAAHVDFLTVNTDPVETSISPSDPAVTQTGLSSRSNWRLLSGSVPSLNTVWRNYGVSINVSATGIVAHNDVMYLIDPRGRLRLRATPFADESPSGTFTLPSTSVDRWAQGIATYAASLLPAAR